MRKAFAGTSEQFVRACLTPPALPRGVWINKPQALDEHNHGPLDMESGDRVECPKVWRNAPAGRTLGGEVSSFSPTSAKGDGVGYCTRNFDPECPLFVDRFWGESLFSIDFTLS